jgi:hypothetical protein
VRGVPAKGADGGVPRVLELNSRFGASVVRIVFFGSGSKDGPEPRVVVDDLEEALGVRASGILGVFFVGVLDKA